MNFLISGGGTGGHIFPAVSIANALRELQPDCKILFVGALGRMEMERVPEAGYEIIGLPVRGFNRQHPIKNFSVLWDLFKSLRQAKKIVREFQPNVAIGVGGYASGAAMKAASRLNIPVLLQEQNGFAGVTNKLLKDDAARICVAYEGMERFFPAEKIILTGNPVRQDLQSATKKEGLEFFGFDGTRQVVLVIGGSLGARTINESILAHLDEIETAGIELIWQTGKVYYDKVMAQFDGEKYPHIHPMAFLSCMPKAYAAADVVISRAGASSISELALLGKASILVPSPNVAEDHQTHNAMALVKKDAALLVKDIEAKEELVKTTLTLLSHPEKMHLLEQNILSMAHPHAATQIAKEAVRLAK